MASITWEELEAKCTSCQKCPLGKTRKNTVIGCGNKNADIMFVGEAPGADEDAAGIPFVGVAGKLLDKYLDALGIEREDVYIANILKCRPPHNRDPLPEEEDACIDYLRAQVKLVQPKIIVCLGRISALRLISSDFKITRDHGKWFKKGAYEMTAVYHPSLLLRDPSRRDEMLADLREVALRAASVDSEQWTVDSRQ